MSKKIHREITQLSHGDSFLVYSRIKDDFNYPLHFHPEYELNFIHKGKGVRRVIGNHIGEISDYELVLVGPNLPHCWEIHNCQNEGIHEITVHIQKDLLDETLLSRSVFKPIKDMLKTSLQGISFSEETIKAIMPRLKELPKKGGINYFLEFVSILHDLSISEDQKVLSTSISNLDNYDKSDKIKKVQKHVQENFQRKISLGEISSLVNMTSVSFNRFIKKRTGKTFVAYVNSMRISHASKLLIETDLSVGEIAFKCGFNNLANFNRMFKKIKNNTPSEFKTEFNNVRKAL